MLAICSKWWLLASTHMLGSKLTNIVGSVISKAVHYGAMESFRSMHGLWFTNAAQLWNL